MRDLGFLWREFQASFVQERFDQRLDFFLKQFP
jgi:hypothetical protein